MHLSLMNGSLNILSESEIEGLYASALKLLETSGVQIENDHMLERFQEAGAKVDQSTQRVTFSVKMVEDHINEIEKVDWSEIPVRFSSVAEIYEGYYLDPHDNSLQPWNLDRLLNIVKLKQKLPGIDAVYMLGCPLKETPVNQQPLYEKLLCWKYGIRGGQSIWDLSFCPQIYEMYSVFADAQHKPLAEVFEGTVYLISPLRLGYLEADHFMYFYKKGLQVRVGINGVLGAGLPVTPAGGLAVQLAESFFISLLERIFFGQKRLTLGASISVLDMMSAAQQYGRPEKSMTNIAMAQVAKWLKLPAGGHCGLSDAKVPSVEAGVQKTMSALFTAMTTGNGYIAAGLLSSDEIFSPIQMILDHESMRYLNFITNGFAINEDTLAMESILEEGPGASFLGTDHTAANFREALWQTSIWSTQSMNGWQSSQAKNDIDKAKQLYFSVLNDPEPVKTHISEETEEQLKRIIG